MFLARRGYESDDAGVKWRCKAVQEALVNNGYIVGFLCYRVGKLLELCPSYPARNGLAQIGMVAILLADHGLIHLGGLLGEFKTFRMMPLNAEGLLCDSLAAVSKDL